MEIDAMHHVGLRLVGSLEGRVGEVKQKKKHLGFYFYSILHK